MADPDDVVTLSLAVVGAADVVADDEDIRCWPAGTEFLRVDVAGTFATDDGALSGPLTGWIEAEAADPAAWMFEFVMYDLAMTGDDRALAQDLTVHRTPRSGRGPELSVPGPPRLGQGPRPSLVYQGARRGPARGE